MLVGRRALKPDPQRVSIEPDIEPVDGGAGSHWRDVTATGPNAWWLHP